MSKETQMPTAIEDTLRGIRDTFIRKLSEDGYLNKQIAFIMNISEQSISLILKKE